MTRLSPAVLGTDPTAMTLPTSSDVSTAFEHRPATKLPLGQLLLRTRANVEISLRNLVHGGWLDHRDDDLAERPGVLAPPLQHRQALGGLATCSSRRVSLPAGRGRGAGPRPDRCDDLRRHASRAVARALRGRRRQHHALGYQYDNDSSSRRSRSRSPSSAFSRRHQRRSGLGDRAGRQASPCPDREIRGFVSPADRKDITTLAVHQAAGLLPDRRATGQIQKLAAKLVGKEAQQFLGGAGAMR